MTFTALGFFFCGLAVQHFQAEPVIRGFEAVPRQDDSSQYPTVTICPVQFHDPYNLYATLVNTRVRPDEDFQVSREALAPYEAFLRKFLTHRWISDNELSQMTDNERATFQRILPHFVFNRDSTEMLADRWYDVWAQDKDTFFSESVSQTTSGVQTVFTVDKVFVMRMFSVVLQYDTSVWFPNRDAPGHFTLWASNSSTVDLSNGQQCSYLYHEVINKATGHLLVECEHGLVGRYLNVGMTYPDAAKRVVKVGPVVQSRRAPKT